MIMFPPLMANGWQLCAALYGLFFGLRMVWPGIFGIGETTRLVLNLGDLKHFYTYVGVMIVAHSLSSFVSVCLLDGRSYWCPSFSSTGAAMWTFVGISHAALEMGAGSLPSWGVFEFLLGIGLVVSTAQRARHAALII